MASAVEAARSVGGSFETAEEMLSCCEASAPKTSLEAETSVFSSFSVVPTSSVSSP